MYRSDDGRDVSWWIEAEELGEEKEVKDERRKIVTLNYLHGRATCESPTPSQPVFLPSIISTSLLQKRAIPSGSPYHHIFLISQIPMT